jgi:hypothetical protein
MKPTHLFYLDLLATIFGVIGGVAQLLVRTHWISENDGLLISGLATIALGIVANKGKLPYRYSPKPPNYYPYEFAHYDSPPYNDPYYEPPPAQASFEATEAPTETTYKSKYTNSRAEPSKFERQADRSIDCARFKRNTGRRLKSQCKLPNTD